jgi:tellurite resistance protein
VIQKFPFGISIEAKGQASAFWQRVLALPPNLFAIAMGLAGLAGVWQLAAKLDGLPLQISATLYLLTTVIYLGLLAAFVCKALFARQSMLADLTHPLFGPFHALLPLSGMLLALGLQPSAPQIAQTIFFVFLAVTVGLACWMMSRWLLIRLDLDMLHSGYYLPTVAGGATRQ